MDTRYCKNWCGRANAEYEHIDCYFFPQIMFESLRSNSFRILKCIHVTLYFLWRYWYSHQLLLPVVDLKREERFADGVVLAEVLVVAVDEISERHVHGHSVPAFQATVVRLRDDARLNQASIQPLEVAQKTVQFFRAKVFSGLKKFCEEMVVQHVIWRYKK